MVSACSEAVELLPRQQGIPRRRARGTGNIGVFEESAFLREAVKCGGLHHSVPIGSGVRPTPIIRHAEENVGLGSARRFGLTQ